MYYQFHVQYPLWYILQSNFYSKLIEYREIYIQLILYVVSYVDRQTSANQFFQHITINFIREYDKIYIYSPSLLQALYQKLIKCSTNYIHIHIRPNVLNEEDIEIVIDELINNKVFENSDTEIETIDNLEEIKYPQEYENNSIFILDDLSEKEINNDKIQAMFKRGRHNNFSIFIIGQDY